MKKTASNSKLPSHISAEKLPRYVRYDHRGRGRWVYQRRINGKIQETRLGDSRLTLADIWRRVDDLTSDRIDSFRSISKEFQQSPAFKRLSSGTQKDYQNCHLAICERETRAGDKFGEVPLDAWTPGAVRRYRDARAEDSESRAAHEIRYMKRVFKWAIQYDLTSENPAKEVEINHLVNAREHYVQDDDYLMALYAAPWKVAIAAHIAYITGRRRKDVLSLKLANVQPEGLLLQEGKTKKESLVQWSDDLLELVEMLKEDGNLSFFTWSESGFDTAWQRVRKAVQKAGGIPFQFKDLRAKYASDLDAMGDDAAENLLHSSQQVTRRNYLRLAKKVVSLGKVREQVREK